MGKITNLGRTTRGVDLKTHTSIWLGWGYLSSWPDETNPPDEDVTQSTVDEIVGYKLLSEASMVVIDVNGDLDVGGLMWRRVADADLDSVQPTELYLSFNVEPDELTLDTYRQIGIFVDLVPKEGYTSRSVLLPSEVLSEGRLIYLSNELPKTRQSSTRHSFEVILPM